MIEEKLIRVSDFNLPELSIYASSSEVLLKRYFEPEPGLFIAESPNVIERAVNGGYVPMSFLIEESHFDAQMTGIIDRFPEVPVYTADLKTLSEISGFKQTRGVLAAMYRKKLPSIEEILKDAKRIAILEDVENPTNAGAIFRSAAALGIDAVILTPGAADPLYRRAARVSMGTVFQVPWTFAGKKDKDWPGILFDKIKNMGFSTAAMALTDNSVPVDAPEIKKKDKLAILLGNEENGLRKETIASSDYTVKIPMSHGVDSLNVAAAAAVVFWELRAAFSAL